MSDCRPRRPAIVLSILAGETRTIVSKLRVEPIRAQCSYRDVSYAENSLLSTEQRAGNTDHIVEPDAVGEIDAALLGLLGCDAGGVHDGEERAGDGGELAEIEVEADCGSCIGDLLLLGTAAEQAAEKQSGKVVNGIVVLTEQRSRHVAERIEINHMPWASVETAVTPSLLPRG